MTTQPTIVVVPSLNQLPTDVLARLYSNNTNILPSKPSQIQSAPSINRSKPIILQTNSPALRMVISDKPYTYQVGPLEYFAGRIFQLW